MATKPRSDDPQHKDFVNAAADMTRKERLERDGYIVVEQLLTPAEVARLRAALVDHFSRQWIADMLGKHQPGAAYEIPAIGWIFAHPPLLAIFRDILGSGNLKFTVNCDVHSNMLNLWHKDLNDTHKDSFREGYFTSPDFRLYRAGIYLQDHVHNRQGLHVRVGSHRTPSLSAGDLRYLPTRAGDVVFFDIRLTHGGALPDPLELLLWRIAQRLRTHTVPSLIKDLYWRAAGKRTKHSIFFTVGSNDTHTSDFCRFEAKNLQQRVGAVKDLPENLLTALSAAGVRGPGVATASDN